MAFFEKKKKKKKTTDGSWGKMVGRKKGGARV